jgi:4-hydroxy-2-oxoheptanedioate aldolase
MAGTTRATRYGAVKDYATRASEEICLLVQVETAEALANIEAIAAVDGVDGIFIGPADLAASMGYPGQGSHPEVKAAVVDALKRITAAGLPAGFLSLDPVMLDAVNEAGGTFIAVDVDMVLLRREATAKAAQWRDKIG